MAKKKTWIVLIVLAILVACLPVGGMAEDTALVQNPNFDSWVEDGNLRNWEFETSDYQNTISYTQDNGNDCIVIDNFSPAYSYVYQEIPVEADTFYRVSCVAKVENLSGEGTGANISLAGETAISNVLTDEAGWQPLALYFRTGSEATTVSLRIGLGQESAGEKGSAYFDTVSVKPVDGFPAGVTPYVLGQFGSIAVTDDASSGDSDSNPMYEYDNWALAIWGALLCFVLYLFISSRWAKQWGGYIKSPNTVILMFAAALLSLIHI